MRGSTLMVIVAGVSLAIACRADQFAQAADSSRTMIAESADISGLPEKDCQACFLLDALGGVIPIPARYVVSTDFLKSKRCLNFVAPHGPLLRPLEPDATLKARSGTINYCRPQDLDKEISQLLQKRSPSQTLRSGPITISVWEPDEEGTKQGYWHAYFRSESEALWISDANPSLWKEMLKVLERTRE